MRLLKHEMEEEIRKTGIDVIGDAPWGTHFCQFYQTKEDLIDVLVPYFKAGLENNEFCMWVISGSLSEEEAEEAMRKAVPDFDRYLKRGQIEIVPHTEWYLKDGTFDLRRVLNAWIDKLDQALAKGYDGIRVTGNTAWLEKRDWRNFAEYEEEVNDVISKYRMMAVCTYSLEKCGASEVIDVVRNHQFALIKRRGEWELIESSDLKRTKEALQDSEERLRAQYKGIPIPTYTWQRVGEDFALVDYNDAAVAITHGKIANYVGKKASEMYRDKPKILEELLRCFTEKTTIKREMPYRFMSTGESKYFEVSYAFVPPDLVLVHIEDITERKRAEEALKESELFLNNVIEQSPFSTWISDDKGTNIKMNDACRRLFGIKKDEEVIGKYNMFKDNEVKRQGFMPLIKEVFTKGKTVNLVIDYDFSKVKHVKVPRATHRLLDVTIFPIKDVNGKVTNAVVQHKDVTEQKKMEESLKQSEEKFRNIFESANDGMIYLDASGRILDVNEKAVQVFGGSKRELLGKHFTRVGIFSREDIPELESNFANILAGKKTTVNIHIKNKKGQEIYLECSASPMKTDGKLAVMMVIARDVTERKMMEEKLKEYTERLEEKVKERTKELRESEERYSSIVNDAIDSLESGIFILDKKFKVVWINKAVEKFFGVNKDNLIGKDKRKAIKEKIKYAFEDPERFEKTVLATYDNNTYVENFECHVLPSKDREERFLVHWSIPIKTGAYAGGRIEHYYDITKLKQMEHQLLKSERLAAIGELATIVGHDLRNPLQAIENATYYLNNELPFLSSSFPNPQKAMEMLQVINNSINYADKIITDLRDFSATKKPMLKKTDINAIIKETLSQVEAPENVELRTELGHLPEIAVDKDQIKRVFINLTLNGIQAMENGGILTVSTKKTRGFIEISFKDTGVGIPKENMEKLFIPFVTTKAKGLGMGLAICKKFVDAHGGTIEVESQEGKGTTFTVKLPIQQENGGEHP